MSTVINRSFAGGEVAPAFYARVDMNRYANSLRTMRNFIAARHGGASNRPGTKFIGEVKDSSKTVRLIPFIFNNDQTYVLEFGDFYMRVIKTGGQGQEASKAISAINQANPGVFTSNTHGFLVGQEIALNGIEGMTDLNQRNFKVSAVTTNTFSLKYMDGVDVDTTSFPAYTTVFSTGAAARVYEIVSPYAYADLAALDYAEAADVVYFTHKSYPPYVLRRTGDLAWSMALATFTPDIARPVALAATLGASGTNTYQYKVTAIAKADGAESLPALQAAVNVSGVSNANPAVVTANLHGYDNGNEVYFTGLVGMTELNGKVFVIANVSTNTFELQGLDSTAFGVWTSGGTVQRTSVTLKSAAAPTLVAPNVITWTSDPLVQEYDVYREDNGQFGFLGVAVGGTFNDIGAPINATKTPPIFRLPFDGPGNYPGVVSFHQQRLAFASSTNDPQGVWESRVGQFGDFSISSPVQDDDSLQYRLAGTRVQEIRHLLDLKQFLIFTSGAEYDVEGDGTGTVTPFAINARYQSGNGSSILKPIPIDNMAIFVQARGAKVRDLSFNLQVDGYQGNDLSIFSSHLFEGFTLVDWSFAQEPNSVVWCVRSDGTLLGMTYIREQQISGWHRHDTDGSFENVVCIPEGTEDATYVVVKRQVTLNGSSRTVRYVERMNTRFISDIEDCVFMDAALSFDGTNKSGTILTLTTADSWTSNDLLTLTITGSFNFTAADVGNGFTITDPATGKDVRFEITEYVSASVVKGLAQRDVPESMQDVGLTVWSRSFDEFGGLWHIEGKLVSVLGDGFVMASPGNPEHTRVRVTNGKIQLDSLVSKVTVGLFYASDLETLDYDSAQSETAIDKSKQITKVTLYLQESRGIFTGSAPPTVVTGDLESNESFVEGLEELPPREDEDPDSPPALVTDPLEQIVLAAYNKNGRTFVRQIDPLPASVLAIAPSGNFPR